MTALSVLIPCWNDGDTLERSVRSCLAQEGAALEVLILDNGSTDDTLETALTLKAADARIRMVASVPENIPHPAAINLLAADAASPWLLIHGADDWLAPGYAAATLEAARRRPDVNCIFSPLIHASGMVQRYPVYDPATLLTVKSVAGKRAVRRDLWDRVGGEDEGIAAGADWDWAVRASLCGLVPLQLPDPYVHLGSADGRTRLAAQCDHAALRVHMARHLDGAVA
jgi:glycosyltransferase involved in cell wall biosynthesis